MTTNHSTRNQSNESGADGDDTDSCRIILNPTSGAADHVDEVRTRAETHGYEVEETSEAGDAIELAKEAAAEGVRTVAACGGDGTIQEVVRGLDEADAFEDVTFAVVPGGTGNNFAQNVGVRDIEHAFELLEGGERRRIDLGVADGEPFANSCVAGLTAKTSSETDSESKERFGTLAYVIACLQQAVEFDPLHVEIETGGSAADASKSDGSTTWSGEALGILVGNARRFTDGGGQADVEDGLFEVTIVEEMATSEMLTEAAAQRVFGKETEHVSQHTAASLEIESRESNSIEFSLDGEISTHEQLSLHVRPRTLEVVVGPGYSPTPDE